MTTGTTWSTPGQQDGADARPEIADLVVEVGCLLRVEAEGVTAVRGESVDALADVRGDVGPLGHHRARHEQGGSDRDRDKQERSAERGDGRTGASLSQPVRHRDEESRQQHGEEEREQDRPDGEEHAQHQ
jgi:hypothetical protein